MTATPMSDEALATAMADLRERLRARGLSVRATEKWGHNQRFNTNNAMFAARVDADGLLRKTDLAVDFGLSPFAIQRGNRVEQIGRANRYAVTIDLLRTNFGFGIDEVVPLDLRHGFPKNEQGMIAPARRTRQATEAKILGRPGAPNIIDGAVLARRIGSRAAYFEADGVGAKAGPAFHVNEFKGWAVVDGRAEDVGKLGAARRRWGLPLPPERSHRGAGRLRRDDLLCGAARDAEERRPDPRREQGRPDCPDPRRRDDIAESPRPGDYVGAQPAGLTSAVSPKLTRPFQHGTRPSTASWTPSALGTQDSCLTSCGLAKFCRARAHARNDPALADTTVIRSLPGVYSSSGTPRASGRVGGQSE
jgi:hypothetical protein